MNGHVDQGGVPGTHLVGGVSFDGGGGHAAVAYLCQKLEPVTVFVPLV